MTAVNAAIAMRERWRIPTSLQVRLSISSGPPDQNTPAQHAYADGDEQGPPKLAGRRPEAIETESSMRLNSPP